MNKKDYVDAMNEISPRENLKKETFNKVTAPKKKYNRLYKLATVAAMLAVIVGVGVPLHNLDIKEQENKPKVEVAKTENKLPRVENFENLYAMVSKIETEDYTEKFLTDSATTNSTATKQEMASKEDNTDYSKTNTQVQGVDEADIVKTDGNYIYYLSNKKITITNAKDLKIASQIKFKDEENFGANELFLRNNKLIAIGYKYDNETKRELTNLLIDCIYPVGSQYTVVRVYDITNRENPKLERTVEVEGSYLDSRMIGNDIYVMANKGIYFYKEDKIEDLNENDYKPKYVDTAVNNEVQCKEFRDICYIPKAENKNYLNIASFNVTNNEPANIDSYLGAGNEIYVSRQNLYVTKVNYDYENGKNYSNYTLTTEVYKFNLIDGKCNFDKSGKVPGSVLNQFSMDENGEYFRIATTNSKGWEEEENTNNLYVLNNNLEIVGKVEGLAKGEKIYSVRFMGNRAYMVTFVQTDPLFVIDLSNPEKPTVLGELKIPGYSKYLHPYDETHIIGFGEKTKVVNYGYGDRVITDGMKMALFDVTDPTNPKELYSTDIGERGTYSELLYNHKALLFSKEKNIIAFPISITEDDYNVEFQGAIVYGLSLEEGFNLKGKISHIEEGYDLYKAESRVDRIIYINDTLYTLSNNLIKATDMNNMNEINKLKLTD